MEDNNIISASEVSILLGLSRRAVYDLITSGKIKATKFERSWIINRASVLALKAKREAKKAIKK